VDRVFFADRGKTGVPVGGALNDRALAALDAYLVELGCELLGDAPIFRTCGPAKDIPAGGRPWQPRPTPRPASARISGWCGSPLADFRRSVAVEAIAGDATPAALAHATHAMGNTRRPMRFSRPMCR
jgi:hypothetical protein